MSSPTVPSASDDEPRDEREPWAGAHEAHVRTGVLVDAFADDRRRHAQLEAREIRHLADLQRLALGDHVRSPQRTQGREIARRSVIAELATAARVSEWTVARLLGEASDLCERFDGAVAALEQGEVSRRHVSVIHEAGMQIDDDADRAEFVDLALARARELSPGRLEPVARALAARFVEPTLADRLAAARERRRVDVVPLTDGMAILSATLEATLAFAIEDRLTQQARAVIDARDGGPQADAASHDIDGRRSAAEASDMSAGAHANGMSGSGRTGEGPDAHAHAEAQSGTDTDTAATRTDSDTDTDTRTMAQLRADVLTDLLLTGEPNPCLGGEDLGAIRATVQVTVPVLTMTGASNEPCLLAGYGPIDPETARHLAGAATGWERVMTSPVDGSVLRVDRYRPGSALRRFLAARDERCRFPGCRRAVRRCDVDHTVDWEHGGRTTAGNLAHLCRRHHTLKHASAWTVEQVSAGVLVWTSPSGRRHTDRPEPTVRFVPDDEIAAQRRRLREPWLFGDDGPDGAGAAPF